VWLTATFFGTRCIYMQLYRVRCIRPVAHCLWWGFEISHHVLFLMFVAGLFAGSQLSWNWMPCHLLFICLLSPHEPGPRLRSHRHECPYIRVPVNTRLNAFQLWSYSFTLIRVRTSTRYLWISLVRAVSVQVAFLSNHYEINNTQFVLV